MKIRIVFLMVLFCFQCGSLLAQKRVFTKAVEVTNETLKVTIEYVEEVDCLGNRGSIQISINGGSGTYAILWSGPSSFSSTDEDLFDLDEGSYSVQVTDATSGCIANSVIEITYSCPYTCGALSIEETSNIPPSNCVLDDGTLTYTITGGTGPYTYTLSKYTGNYTVVASGSSASNVITIPNIGSGAYEFNVQAVVDGQDCFSGINSSIGVVLQLTNGFVTGSNTSCANPNGVLVVNPVNATSLTNLTYFWSNIYTGQTFNTTIPQLSNLPQGYYSVAVTDTGNGCEVYGNGQVNNSGIELAITPLENTSASTCAPGNGVLDISITNGTGNYTYAWFKTGDANFFKSTKRIQGLTEGNYTVYTSDNVSGCSKNQAFTVLSSALKPELQSVTIVENTNCSPFNGSLTAILTPASPTNVSYNWFDELTTSVGTSATATGLAPGNYGLRITNLTNGCEWVVASQAGIGYNVPDAYLSDLVVTAESIGNTACTGPYTGAIDLQITSQKSYTSSWRGPGDYFSTDQDPAALKEGTYMLLVEFACAQNQPPTIQQPGISVTTEQKTIQLNLLSLISDPDNNLDPASIEITGNALSGAIAEIQIIDNIPFLILEYGGITFTGSESIQIQACDLDGACTTEVLQFPVETNGDLVIYNAISPNGDDLNAYFRIDNIEGTTNKVSIFNRWGDEVYSANNYDNDTRKFDGTGKSGKTLPAGNYFYTITIEGRSVIRGFLTIKP